MVQAIQRWVPGGLTLLALACSPSDRPSQQPAGDRAQPTEGGPILTGAGATFPNPIYTKWFDAYNKKTGVQINYQSIGSGGGIRQLTEGTVDFGASDAPMTDEEMSKLKTPVYHVPTVLGAVVITYNVPGVTQPLKLAGDVVADVFAGKLTKWNDPRITATNAGTKLAFSDAIRKSQASARLIPAPAAAPLTAATTGLGSSARARILGL